MNFSKMNLKRLFICMCFISVNVSANDSTGYIGTGGIQYLKNDKISMHSEDLFISKKLIKVDYQFKNLSHQDITETVLFPLPPLMSYMDWDFADTSALIKSFKINVNGKSVQPKLHIRAFMQPVNKNGEIDWDAEAIDVTNEFKKCGLTDQELLIPWMNHADFSIANQKIYQCKDPKVQALTRSYTNEDMIIWSSQVVYSWQQTFKANSVTRVQHQYQPLVGGSVALYPDEHNQQFCMDNTFKQGLKKANAQHAPFSALSYILTTGANWAKPIEKFRLVIERDQDELVSFCWDGQVKKLNATQFEMTKRNFLPKRDLDVIFVRRNLN